MSSVNRISAQRTKKQKTSGIQQGFDGNELYLFQHPKQRASESSNGLPLHIFKAVLRQQLDKMSNRRADTSSYDTNESLGDDTFAPKHNFIPNAKQQKYLQDIERTSGFTIAKEIAAIDKNNCHSFDEEFDAAMRRGFTEIIAGEWFRLHHQNQPRMYVLTREGVTGMSTVLVMSEAVSDSVTLSEYCAEHNKDIATLIDEGKITGLGGLVVTACVLEELDNRRHNLMVKRSTGQVIKIDCGQCLTHLQQKDSDEQPRQFVNNLVNLPNIDESRTGVCNWLDIIHGGRRETVAQERVKKMQANQDFMHEKHKALLQLFILPDNLIKAFCYSYGIDSQLHQDIYNDFSRFRDEARNKVLKDKPFLRYVFSADAAIDLQQYAKYLNAFSCDGESRLVDHCEGKLSVEMQHHLFKISLFAENASDINLHYQQRNKAYLNARRRSVLSSLACGMVCSAVSIPVITTAFTLSAGLIMCLPLFFGVTAIAAYINQKRFSVKHPDLCLAQLFYETKLADEPQDVTPALIADTFEDLLEGAQQSVPSTPVLIPDFDAHRRDVNGHAGISANRRGSVSDKTTTGVDAELPLQQLQ